MNTFQDPSSCTETMKMVKLDGRFRSMAFFADYDVKDGDQFSPGSDKGDCYWFSCLMSR